MKKLWKVDGIGIYITIKENKYSVGKYTFYSSKYNIWCMDDFWEVAQENLEWILKDKVTSYIKCPDSELSKDQRKWKSLYSKLVNKGLKIDSFEFETLSQPVEEIDSKSIQSQFESEESHQIILHNSMVECLPVQTLFYPFTL